MKQLFQETFLHRCRKNWFAELTCTAGKEKRKGFIPASTPLAAFAPALDAETFTGALPGTIEVRGQMYGAAAQELRMDQMRAMHRQFLKKIFRKQQLRL